MLNPTLPLETTYSSSAIQHTTLAPELIARYRVIPLKEDEQTLYLGISDTNRTDILSDISFQTGLTIKPIQMDEEDIEHFIKTNLDQHFYTQDVDTALLDIISNDEVISDEEIEEDEPIIRIVSQLIDEAINKKISDIHLEPFNNECRVRFRSDGILHEYIHLPIKIAARVISRLKVMANLNITEKRVPQDGRLITKKQYGFDIRINCCPTIHGEKVVLRLLKSATMTLEIPSLGFNKNSEKIFLHHLSQPQGLILVAGPTGSGKTNTLYSALHHLNQIDKNISTAEDPVEIELPGIIQMNVNSSIGLSFATILRALLRQDPDIIMIGEIRDAETAEIAIQAAQTGHLVLSTIHANNAIHTFTRLQALGISNDNIINSLNLIIAQRLIRTLCTHCKIPEIHEPQFGGIIYHTYRANGCTHCHQGYRGRTGIFELLPIPLDTSSLLNTDHPSELLLQLSNLRQSRLVDAGIAKIHEGISTYTELTRVIGPENHYGAN